MFVRSVLFLLLLTLEIVLLIECVGGFYNRTCTGVCGHCVNGKPCLPDIGHCANGCINYFLDPFCQGKTFIITSRHVTLR